MDRELVFIRAGFGDHALAYDEAWDLQRQLHARRVSAEIPDACLLLEHQPVYTAGRRTSEADRPAGDPGAPVIEVDRGGKITWHGPGQLVGYPILALDEPMDVIAYVRAIEEALIRACAEAGLRTTRVSGRSGVWVRDGQDAGPGGSTAAEHSGGLAAEPGAGLAAEPGGESYGAGLDRKVGAIGIRVARGVTMHGFALNCDNDLSWFDRIVPCGISDATVTSISAELGRPVTVTSMLGIVERQLAGALGAGRVRCLDGVAELDLRLVS